MERRSVLEKESIILMTAVFLAAGFPEAGRAIGFGKGKPSDLAIGAPGEEVSSQNSAGAVSVLYGSKDRLLGGNDEYWQQNMLSGTDAESSDAFGRSLATGDFNGDGVYDLAVGSPFEDIGSIDEGGAIHIIYGTRTYGLETPDNQYWNQEEIGVDETTTNEDHFGWAVAAGDFNGDGYDDLAVGIPRKDIRGTEDCGAVHIFYGSTGGLTTSGNFQLEMRIVIQTDARFGSSLATGDFNKDGFDDLAVGAPSWDIGTIESCGAVEVFRGSSTGLYPWQADYINQNTAGISDSVEDYDYFGRTLCTGDFDGDGYDDLAIGVYFEDVEAVENAGAVHVLYGSNDALSLGDEDFWHQDVGIVGSLAEEDDRFGWALCSGDFNGDGKDDLAIGSPFEHWNLPDTGIVQILYGTEYGLDDAGTQLWRQDEGIIVDTEEENDQFGYAVASGDFDADGYEDLAIGCPGEGFTGAEQCGTVHIIFGSSTGLRDYENTRYYQGVAGSDGTLGDAETVDHYGFALAASPMKSVIVAPMLHLLLEAE